ncbi:MAG: carboxylating nicotinate-nucleotide diphosphorylase [Candidatus Bipolaricaulota bacterium]
MDIASLLRSAGPLIERALSEDIGTGDRTTESIVPPDATARCILVAKAAGVIAGLPVAEVVFRQLNGDISMVPYVQDGEPVEAGQAVAQVQGPARPIFTAERTALNFLGRLSGIATLTAQFVDAVTNHQAVILDTRKTTPGWRELEKYAVRCGGGRNHRMGLHDMVLIKDNHIAAAGGLGEAVRRVRAAGHQLPLQVEVSSLAELRAALELGVERLLLDNMDLATLRRAVHRAGGRAFLEASGGVSLQRAAEIAATGVDAISVGALTHSAPALDLSLELSAP